MIKKYLLSLLHNIKKEPFNFLIAILAVAIGLSAFTLLLNFSLFYFNFDKGEKDWQNWYRARIITQDSPGNFTKDCYFYVDFVPYIRQENPEIKDHLTDFNTNIKMNLICNGKKITMPGFNLVTANFAEHYKLRFIYGDPKKAIVDKGLIISRSANNRLFNGKNSIGTKLYFNNNLRFIVTGVFEDIPKNFHYRSDYYTLQYNNPDLKTQISEWSFYGFEHVRFMIPDKAKIPAVEARINKLFKNHTGKLGMHNNITVKLDPIHSLHFTQGLNNDKKTINPSKIYSVFIVGILLLFAALLSFLNLHILHWKKRIEEFSFRKAIGAEPKDLLMQLLYEYSFLFILSEMVALIIYFFAYPIFAQLCGHDIILYNIFSPLKLSLFLGIPLLLAILLAIPQIYKIASSPYLDSENRRNSKNLGNNLILFAQITLTLIFLISGQVIYSQIHFIKSVNLGYDQHNLIEINYISATFPNQIAPKTVIQAVRTLPHITRLSGSQFSVINESENCSEILASPNTFLNINNKLKPIKAKLAGFYPDFNTNLKIKVLSGRMPNSGAKEFIVNKTFVNQYCSKINPLGLEIISISDDSTKTRTTSKITGVMDDCYFFPVHASIQPLMFWSSEEFVHFFQVGYNKSNKELARKELDSLFTKFEGQGLHAYDSKDVELTVQAFYKEDNLYLLIISFIAILLLILTIFSLYSITSIHLDRQKNDITLMKVWGAEPKHIFKKYSKYYLIIFGLSSIAGIAVSYYLTSLFLSRFSQTIEVTFQYYFIGLLITALIVVIPLIINIRRIYYQKSSDTLRSE